MGPLLCVREEFPSGASGDLRFETGNRRLGIWGTLGRDPKDPVSLNLGNPESGAD